MRAQEYRTHVSARATERFHGRPGLRIVQSYMALILFGAYIWYNQWRLPHCGIATMSDSKQLLSPPATEGAAETVQFMQPAESSTVITHLLPTGTRMGHYTIKKYIGGGGMGQVYQATDEALDRDVAIKVLTQQRAGDHGTVARFLNEARSAARLNHEHIAQVYFSGEASGIPFIAFEYVEGINVRTMVEEHDVFPLPQALNYLLQIAHALAHAAMHNVVHRDVKPSNILITREGRAKLIDMGLARQMDTSEARGDLTASGVTLGTFDYISPEQARDPRNADIRSDIYSLGCTFFYMLAGRPPFPEGTVLQKLLQHQGDAPPDIRSFQPTIPAEIAFLIQKMMAKDPRQRFQTPAVLIDALTDVARRLGLRPAGQGSLVWTPVRPNRTSLLLRHIPWIAAVSMLFVGFFLVSLILDRYEPPPPPELRITASPSSATTVEIATSSDEVPTKIPASSFEVAFVSYPTVRSSKRLAMSVPGGGLQSALAGTNSFSVFRNGSLSVADVKSASPSTATPRAGFASNIRSVDPTGITPGSYLSIAAALTGAGDGTTIELKWNGTLRTSEPIRVDQRGLRIVAAEGFEPILLFAPTEVQRSFFTVFSSSLEFKRVGIEVRIDPNVRLTHWSLFELAGNVRLAFDQCCLTIQNITRFDNSPYHKDVVFFRNSTPTFLEGVPTGDAVFDPLTIEITDSLLRGEAVAIRSNVPQDIHVQCTHSLIALARAFIHAEESRRTVRQTMIQIRWDNVAFFGRQEVFHLQKETVADPIVVDFNAQRSVFVLNRSPFAVFLGQQSQSRQRMLSDFRWSGTENYFQGVSGLQFRSPALLPISDMTEMSLEKWQEYWSFITREQTQIGALIFNEIVKPMSRYSPQDMWSVFGSLDNISLPDLGGIPVQWYGD